MLQGRPQIRSGHELTHLVLETTIEHEGIPMSYEDVLKEDETEDWLKSMHFKLNSIKYWMHGTWYRLVQIRI